ncbi:MAG: hypothetical protein IJR99_12215 [Kiritimatiellae bacterium]|nr:hypothetical protein [Kiritimatiellia bacterium]
MKRMKLFETGTVVLCLACFLRACCIEDDHLRKDWETEFFSTSFEDKAISVVRTRRLYSYDPVRWENPGPSDESIWEKSHWVSMSNLYAIVVIDSSADGWTFMRGTAKCPYFYKEMANIGNTCVYNVKDDTLKPSDGVSRCSLEKEKGASHMINEVVDLEELFNRHQSCPSVFFGNGKKGVLFWRGGLDSHWWWDFMTLLWAGRPVDYYTVKRFKTWDEFWSWDGAYSSRSLREPQNN